MAAILNFATRFLSTSNMIMRILYPTCMSSFVTIRIVVLEIKNRKISYMAAILNFATRCLPKSNQIMRRLYPTCMSSFVRIRIAVLEIECSQEILKKNQVCQAKQPKENSTTFLKYYFCILIIFLISKVYIKYLQRYKYIYVTRRRRRRRRPTSPVLIPPFRFSNGAGDN